ncbi:MAG: hypothetical protein ACXV47_05450 [Halobacteriota archaeon]
MTLEQRIKKLERDADAEGKPREWRTIVIYVDNNNVKRLLDGTIVEDDMDLEGYVVIYVREALRGTL